MNRWKRPALWCGLATMIFGGLICSAAHSGDDSIMLWTLGAGTVTAGIGSVKKALEIRKNGGNDNGKAESEDRSSGGS